MYIHRYILLYLSKQLSTGAVVLLTGGTASRLLNATNGTAANGTECNQPEKPVEVHTL